MAKLKILVAPDPRLKMRAEPIAAVDDEIRTLMDDMLETMYAAPGIGLAATQVGVMKRVLVIDLADKEKGEKPNPIKLANPEIIKTEGDDSIYEEGCLSIPGFYEEVVRPERCTVTGLNEKGEKVTLHADGLLSTCLQHEIDHLNGTLFIDHLSRTKRDIILRKLKKEKVRLATAPQQQGEEGADHTL